MNRLPLIVFMVSFALGCEDPRSLPNLEARNNEAIGLMGQYDYARAAAIWDQLAAEAPETTILQINLAIAVLNRQLDDDEPKALALLNNVLAQEPDNVRAAYVAGVLRLRNGNNAAAIAAFQRVLDTDSTDAYAWYHLGSAQEASDAAAAVEAYQHAVDLDPYLRSAWYRLGQVSARLDQPARASTALHEFERLETNPRAVMIKPVYGRLGPKALAATLDLPSPSRSIPPGPLWTTPPQALGDPINGVAFPSIADVNGDGTRELIFGCYVHADSNPFEGIDGVRFAMFGDLDNDGGLDAYLARDGANVVMSRDEAVWRDTTEERGLAGGEFTTSDGALVDIDHDGDLDVLLANSNGPTQLFANTLNGVFKDISEETGFAAAPNARQLVIADLDQSSDLDVLLLRSNGNNVLFRNDRLWSFTATPAYEGVVRAVAADLNGDGTTTIFGVRADGTLVENETVLRTLSGVPANLAAIDVDGDGVLELITDDDLPIENLHAWAPVVLDHPESGYSIAAVLENRTPVLLTPGAGRFAFTPITLAGSDDPTQQMRSNANGVGALVTARRGDQWTIERNLTTHGGPGQSLEPMLFGLGGAETLDFLLIDWPDGLIQTELGAAAQGRIVETQRQASSCPVLFAFNGQSMEFVSDVLGVGGIGFLLAPGEYNQPRPFERFPLPRGALGRDHQGFLSLVLCEPMEEACYLDHIALSGWLLPDGWKVAIDERMGINGPQPTGEELFYTTTLKPTLATNQHGDDVSANVLKADFLAAPVGAVDPRFIGRLQEEHVLTLRFDRSLDALDDPWLLMDGWIEYPYSQTMFASWQAEASYDAPSLDALGSDGEWHVIQEQFGYPAGMPRQSAFPLSNLPKGTTALRLRTNQEIYWDALSVIERKPAPPTAQAISVPLREATLEVIGYPERLEQPQRRPDYAYGVRSPLFDFRHLRGLYTALGNVEDLLQRQDETIAIIGPGEGVVLRFDAPLNVDLSAIDWVLDCSGWCKDRDRFTHTGETLTPLPATAPRANRIEAGY